MTHYTEVFIICKVQRVYIFKKAIVARLYFVFADRSESELSRTLLVY